MSFSHELQESMILAAEKIGLCPLGVKTFRLWINACFNNDSKTYFAAYEMTTSAVKNRVERLAVILPQRIFGGNSHSLLVLRPCYAEYEQVKQEARVELPSLPLHLPADVEAGLGSYTDGERLALFFPPAVEVNDVNIASQELVSFELMPTWCDRLKRGVHWVRSITDSSLTDLMNELEGNETTLRHTAMIQILHHERGHCGTLWHSFPNRSDFENNAILNAPAQSRPLYRNICFALSDVAADLDFNSSTTNDVRFATFVYQLFNVYVCFKDEPFNVSGKWMPLETDPDCLGGTLLTNAVFKHHLSSTTFFLSETSLQKGFDDLRCRIQDIVSSLRDGQTDYLESVLNISISNNLIDLLKKGPPAYEQSAYNQRLARQSELESVIKTLLKEIS
jgi:hypothetical protein